MRDLKWLVAAAVMLWAGPAAGAVYLQCMQSELTDPSCNAVSVNHTPLYFTGSCMECEGGGSEPKCTPGEKLTPQTLAMELASTATAVAGTFSQAGTCTFGNILWKFDGGLTKGQTYNIVANVSGHPKTLLLSFTAGASNPGSDMGGLPPGDAIITPLDSGGTTPTGDSGSSTTGDGGGSNGGGGEDDGGCGCRVSAVPAGAGLPLALLLLGLILRRRQS